MDPQRFQRIFPEIVWESIPHFRKGWIPIESEKSQGGEGSDRFHATVLVPQRPFSIRFAVFVEIP